MWISRSEYNELLINKAKMKIALETKDGMLKNKQEELDMYLKAYERFESDVEEDKILNSKICELQEALYEELKQQNKKLEKQLEDTKSIKECISYQTVDSEHDIWCNQALLFRTDKEAINFFCNSKLVLKTLGYELEEGETIDDIDYKIYYTNENFEKPPHTIRFSCRYAGDVEIRKMSKGWVI